jgi:hypothetical protein
VRFGCASGVRVSVHVCVCVCVYVCDLTTLPRYLGDQVTFQRASAQVE